MPFKPLLELTVEHPFYESGRCLGASVVPDPATLARLSGLRLLHRERPGGLMILAELGLGGEPLVAIPNATLGMSLKLDRAVLQATDLADFALGTVFTDAGPGKKMKAEVRQARGAETLRKDEGATALVLAGRPLAGTRKGDFKVLEGAGISVNGYDERGRRVTLEGPAGSVRLDYPVAPQQITGTLASIEIPLSPSLAAKAAAGKPASFAIALTPASAPWCYHLITDLPNPLDEWKIERKDSRGPVADFATAGMTEVAAGDPDDPRGSALVQISPKLRVLRFVSSAPVPCSELRSRKIALSAGTRQLFESLPNPSPAGLFFLKGRPTFGEVLRFVTA
jgi:hypothetical protein